MKKVIVLEYDPNWKVEFKKIEIELVSVLSDCVMGIEHVGSTAVEGLAAKPVIDIDVIIKDYNSFEFVKDRLAQLNYIYEGDLGIKDRQAFKYEDKPHLMKHHLYVCPAYSEELKRHIAFRGFLRENSAYRDNYGKIKLLAAKHYPYDIDGYMKAKSPYCKEILENLGL